MGMFFKGKDNWTGEPLPVQAPSRCERNGHFMVQDPRQAMAFCKYCGLGIPDKHYAKMSDEKREAFIRNVQGNYPPEKL